MATNDFKPFATGSGANVLSQADYLALSALLTGFQSGKASSAQVNKALRQSTFIASALAQFVSDKAGVDVLDDGNVASFVTKLTNAFAKQYLSRANPFGDIKQDGDAAIASALSNLGFTYGTGWYKLGALIIQYGPIDFTGVTSRAVTFPIPFPTEVAQVIVSDAGFSTGNMWGATNKTVSGFTARVNVAGEGGQYFAFGK